ncbi:glycosyltransferase family 4 protein [Brevibacillus sp. FSL L8-0520]|uniref:glycosyltransferase family 4 protein n=1 Tax=Brevibacillus TaxID=55080 RepID=UPI0030CDC306
MRIAVASVQVPFEYGGAEILANNLKMQLILRGHEAEVVTIPFKWYPAESLENSIRMSRLIDLSEMKGRPIDLMIALKFPIYYARHDNKVLWLLHQHREAYELWGTGFDGLDKMEGGDRLRKMIVEEDSHALSACAKTYTISATVSERLRTYNGIESMPLYHPPFGCEHFYTGEIGNYIFCPSRLEELKRQQVLIEALRYTKTQVKVVIAGRGKETFINKMKSAVETYGLQDRVHFLGWISEEEKRKYYANALAVYYGPYQEDYGYVTLESFLSGKPVITHVDAGGPLEFVRNGDNGFVLEPDPKAVAEKLDYLFSNKRSAQTMGMNGLRLIEDMELGWDSVIEKLIG